MERRGRFARVVGFGAFEAQLQTGELRRAGFKVHLQEKPFQVLAALLEHPGELVTREELRERLWSADHFVEFENSLNAAVNKLREALDDTAEHPRFVETLPRRGYRFIAPVTELGAAPPAQRIWARVLLAVTVGAGLAVGLYFAAEPFGIRDTAAPKKVMLAVLPFENLTGDSAQEYFSDGLTEETITQLGRLNPEELGVIARTSTMEYKLSRKSTKQIGHELQADYILEGSVRREKDRVRVSAQLIQVSDQTHLWAESYDRDLRDVLVLQDEVAGAIAGAIGLKLRPKDRARLANSPRLDPEAYQFYLRGRYFWNKRTSQGLNKAIEQFQKAIEIEPNYALAFAGLADSNTLLHYYSGLPTKDTFPKAKAAALKALEIDDSLAEAHTSLAYITHRYEWDWAFAEREFKRAIALNPNYATSHHWYAELLMAEGRFDEAMTELRRAQQLDPLSPRINLDLGLPFYFSRQYDRCIEQSRKVIELDPSFVPAYLALRDCCELAGQYEEAVRAFQTAMMLSGIAKQTVETLGSSYERSGEKGYWRKRLELAITGSQHLYTPSSDMAKIYLALGDKDQAVSFLERGSDERDDEIVWINVEPWFHGLRSDPRFQALLRRLNFPDALGPS